jgi:hypothetical protein
MSEDWDSGGGWMSEAVARKKWCPWARVPHSDNPSAINRTDSGTAASGALCLGSGCMAWDIKSFDRTAFGRCGNRGRD